MKKNGIEFDYNDQRVLLLFDKSLSTLNRVSASAGDGATATTGTATGVSTSTSTSGADAAGAASTGN
jgi:hypothetical protein